MQNPVVSYRWLLGGGDVGYAWVNGLGVVTHDVPDADDFVLSVRRPAPDWHLESVVYEIFPDRFARGGVDAAAAGLGDPARVGRAGRRRAATRPRASGTAATCAGSRSGSATSRRSART